MTTTKTPTVEELTKTIDGLTTQIKALKAAPDLSGIRTDPDGRITSYFEPTDETMSFVVDANRTTNARKSYRAMRKQHRQRLKSFGYKPWGEFKSASDFVRAGFEGGASFESKLGTHIKAIQGMSTQEGSEGGYTIMPEFAPGIIDRVYENSLWADTDNYSVAGNNMTFRANAETSRANGSRHGGLRGYWTGEGQTIDDSKPTWREVSLKLKKLAVIVYLTDELIEDTGDAMEQYVTKKVSEEFNFMTGDSLMRGTGAGQPIGWLNAPSLLAVAAEDGQEAATILPENVVKMYSRFFAPNIAGAKWYHNQDIGPQLDLMTLGIGAAGVAMFNPPNGLADAPFGTLRGRPMQPTEFNPTLGTQGDLMLCDMGQMLSISKGGIVQAISMHVEFLTGQTALRFTMRLDAQPWENAPITPYQGVSNTQSNCVVLATRS